MRNTHSHFVLGYHLQLFVIANYVFHFRVCLCCKHNMKSSFPVFDSFTNSIPTGRNQGALFTLPFRTISFSESFVLTSLKDTIVYQGTRGTWIGQRINAPSTGHLLNFDRVFSWLKNLSCQNVSRRRWILISCFFVKTKTFLNKYCCRTRFKLYISGEWLVESLTHPEVDLHGSKVILWTTERLYNHEQVGGFLSLSMLTKTLNTNCIVLA